MILVTGANGVIGRAVLAQARQLGIDVRGVARQGPSGPEPGSIVCDLSTCLSLAHAVDQVPDGVVHLAAAVPHSPRYPDTEASAAVTRRIDACVRDAVRQWKCHVVYASTCGLYDRRSDAVKLESSGEWIRVTSPYFAAKLDGERMFAESPGGCTVLRLPAPVGPGVPETLVVARFVSLALAGETLSVWGSGRREQNFVDSGDLADAVLRAARLAWSGIINIAAASPVTMLELAHRTVAALGSGQVGLSGLPDPLDGETARFSTDRARAVLGWLPRTPLEDSIRSLAASLPVSRGGAVSP